MVYYLWQMDKPQDSTIDELVRLKLEGSSYTEIRARLTKSGLSKDELKVAMKVIDEKVLHAEIEKGKSEKSKQWYRAGLILAITGLILAIGFNAGIFLSGSPQLLVYSPFIAGIALMFYGRIIQRRRLELSKKDPGRIRRKRPYK